MALNLSVMYGFVVNEIGSKRTLRESMHRIIAECAKGHPHDDWKKLNDLPYDDLDELREWIEKPFRIEPSKNELVGLWFGLCNPVYTSEPVADMYVCGSTRFDPSTDGHWAVDPDWLPESRDAHSVVLATLYEIACREDGLGNDAEYPLCLGFGGLAVRDLLRNTDPSVFLGRSASLGIEVGFDSGDSVLVGKLIKSGLISLS